MTPSLRPAVHISETEISLGMERLSIRHPQLAVPPPVELWPRIKLRLVRHWRVLVYRLSTLRRLRVRIEVRWQ